MSLNVVNSYRFPAVVPCEWSFDNSQKKACDEFDVDNYTHVSTSGSDPDTWGIDTGTGVWTCVYGRNEGIKGMYRALPETIDADFVMRMKWKATSPTRCTGGCATSYCGYHWIGLSSVNTVDSAAAQDFCGMVTNPYEGASSTYVCLANGGAPASNITPNVSGTWTDSNYFTQYYLEIVRDSDDLNVTFFTDSDFSVPYGTASRTVGGSATNDLDYIVAHNLNVVHNPYGTAWAEIEELVIYKDVTSPP